MPISPDQANVGLFIIAAAGVVAVWWRYGRRFFRSLERVFENVNGRPAEFDRAGQKIREAVPSLQAQVADIRTIVADQAKQNDRLTTLEHRVDRLEDSAQTERIVGHVESAQAWKAVEQIARGGEAATS